MRTIISALLLLVSTTLFAKDYDYEISSPDGKLRVYIAVGEGLTWSVRHQDTQVLLPSLIDLRTDKTAKGRQAHKAFKSFKSARHSDGYGEGRLAMKDYTVEFRVYNDAAAYRLLLPKAGGRKPSGITVTDETAEFKFGGDYRAFVPYVNDNRGGERWCYSFESYYDEQPLSQMFADSLAITPLAVCLPDGKKAVVLETGVDCYPGMYLKKGDGNGLVAAFPPYPLQSEIGGYARLNLVPTERAGYIAKNASTLPWRVVMVTENDAQLIGNDITSRLGAPSRIKDTSWIKPGKIAWDWWNNRNLTGVDFEAGINTDTYLYFIDFAKRNGLEYVIVDEGWSSPEDLMVFSDAMDMNQLIRHANEQGVGLILWSSWRNLVQRGPEKMDEIMAHFQQLGVKGFKVDFFDRDDQEAVRSAYEVAACAAKHHLLLDLHGLKPFGIELAYPNILNFEGVKGLENSKWEPRTGDGPLHDQPRYDCTIPYLRNLIGPMDYTPGAMRNAVKSQFFGNNDHPMSQGTRVHQMAMYTVYYAPLQMLADSPTAYEREAECAEFLYAVPTVWDQTIALAGQMGEYAAVARRKGDKWYIGVLNNWTARDLTLDLSPLKASGKAMDVFADGRNAAREATDYKHTRQTVPADGRLTINLAPGGGWTACVE